MHQYWKHRIKRLIKALLPASAKDIEAVGAQLKTVANQLESTTHQWKAFEQKLDKTTHLLSEADDQLKCFQNRLQHLETLAIRNNHRQASYFGANRTASWNLDNLFFIVNVPDCGFPANLIRDSAYEEENYQITQYLWDWERTFLDIGANCGIFAARLGHLTRRIPTQIFAFEPNPEMHELCATNFFNNGLSHCQAIQSAASNTSSPLSLWVNPHHTGGASVTPQSSQSEQQGSELQTRKEVQVNSTTVDSFLQQKKINKPSFAKIDVEHHEGQVLEGMKQTITFMANDNETFGIIFECLDGLVPKPLRAMLDTATEQGYGLFQVISRGRLTRISTENIINFPGYLLLLNKALIAKKLQPLSTTNAFPEFAANRLEIPIAAMITTSISSIHHQSIPAGPSEIRYTAPEDSKIHLIAHGPYCSLHQGNYRIRLELLEAKGITIQLKHDISHNIQTKSNKDGSWSFELDHYTNNLEILLYASGADQGIVKNILIVDETGL